jgi:hypothetical protein
MAQNHTSNEQPIALVQDSSIEQIGAQGSGRMTVYVHGYWSDVISIYVRRDAMWSIDVAAGTRTRNTEWIVSVNHSSGGRDVDQVADDVQAERNFAHGLLRACDFAAELRADVAHLEELYRMEQELRRVEQEQAAAALQARVDADPAVGPQRADIRISRMALDARESGKGSSLALMQRGQDDTISATLEVDIGRNAQVLFSNTGRRITRKDAVDLLAKASLRTLQTTA